MLARIMALESGDPIRDGLIEVHRAATTSRVAAEEAERMWERRSDLTSSRANGRIEITRRFQIGSIAGFSPFNFPLNLAAHKVAPTFEMSREFGDRTVEDERLRLLKFTGSPGVGGR